MSPIGVSDSASSFSGSDFMAMLATAMNASATGFTSAGAGSTATVDLGVLRALLPEAHPGHVISAEHHNALRNAILWLAEQSGASLGKEQRLTSAPTFHRNGDRNEWRHNNGVASATLQASTSGLLPVHLPDGAQIKSLTVSGRREGQIDGFLIELKRQAIKGNSFPTLISIPLEDAPANFEVTEVIDPPNVVPSAVAATKADYELVRNDLYKYFVIAEADNPTNVAEIRTIQITYVV
jgi:hypothetical protein